MSFHIESPALTLTGKKKGKVKFRNAAEAQRARQLESDWRNLLVRHESKNVHKNKTGKGYDTLEYDIKVPESRSTSHIKSKGQTGGVANLVPNKVYTGDKIIGIAQMAKSNAVPVFNSDHIVEIARMRR